MEKFWPSFSYWCSIEGLRKTTKTTEWLVYGLNPSVMIWFKFRLLPKMEGL